MRGISPIRKYLILSIIILAIGVPAAYAITITLGGDPIVVLGILDMMGNKITNVGTPTTSTDAATKAYVDSAPGTDTLALLGCTDTQIAQFDGSAWTCIDSASAISTYLVSNSIIGTSLVTPFVQAFCDPGDFATGGGASKGGPSGTAQIAITLLSPIPNVGGTVTTGYSVQFYNPDLLTINPAAFVICVDLPPLRP